MNLSMQNISAALCQLIQAQKNFQINILDVARNPTGPIFFILPPSPQRVNRLSTYSEAISINILVAQ